MVTYVVVGASVVPGKGNVCTRERIPARSLGPKNVRGVRALAQNQMAAARRGCGCLCQRSCGAEEAYYGGVRGHGGLLLELTDIEVEDKSRKDIFPTFPLLKFAKRIK